MLSIERQGIIKNILLEHKSVSVADLTERFGVSFETIRRDLKVLEKEGMIEKTYGGAVLKQKVMNPADYQTLSHIMVDSKRKMALRAVRLLVPGDCIYIGFSSTCVQVADVLPDIPLVVMTNSLEVMKRLSERKNVTLFSTGGSWDGRNCAFLGRAALDSLTGYHLDKAFISCRGLSMEEGISDKTGLESDMRRRVTECSNEVYLMADSTKFDKVTFVKTCGFDRITGVITDEPMSDHWQSFLKGRGIRCFDRDLSDDAGSPEEDIREDR